jgi:hypothetical protein
MSTNKQDTSQNQYNQAGMGAYNQMQGPMASAATGYMQNPFGNPFFQQQQQMGNRQAMNMGQTGMNNITQNLTASGLMGGGSSPIGLEMLQNQARQNSGLQAQMGFMNPMNNALNMQQNAMGLASGYRPLQTGGKQTETTGGLGTWLPQLAGAALGGMTGMGGLLGGAGNFFGGAGMGPTGNSGMGMQNTGGGAFGEGAGNPFGGGNAFFGGGMGGNMGMPGMAPPPMPGGQGMGMGYLG